MLCPPPKKKMSHSFIQNCCCIIASFIYSIKDEQFFTDLAYADDATILMSDQLQADTRPPINAFAAAWA